MKVPAQPSVNIGVVGHVDHGKTALVHRLTGEMTDRHSEELRRGISIRLGYADAAFYKCASCEPPRNYGTTPKCRHCGRVAKLLRAVSFVDSPGHETLMATMLSGAAIMNGALLVIAANEPCPQPQTREHLMGLNIIGVDKVVVVQNKIDLVDDERAKGSYEEIERFVAGTVAEGAPVVPLSAHHEVNLDALICQIEESIPSPSPEGRKPPRMYVARSFDVNQPGTPPEKIEGGVLGGALVQGKIAVGDEIEICPGRQVTSGGKTAWENLTSKATTLYSGGGSRKEVRPGGLVAVRTMLDPAITKADSLVGRVVGRPNSLPSMMLKVAIETHLLDRVVGVAKELKVDDVKTSEPLMLTVGTALTVGVVSSARGDTAEMNLKIPVCADVGQRAAISRRIGGKWRLIGHGVLR